MTGSRLEPNREVPSAYGAGDTWTRLLVPLLTAALVLGLGMILVSLTSRDEPSPVDPAARSAVSTTVRTAAM
jgi:hypothetical protein